MGCKIYEITIRKRFFIEINLANKDTPIWWDNIHKYRARRDFIISLSRCYFRIHRIYVYHLHLGRLKIMFCNLKQSYVEPSHEHTL